jgi:hypothetical protein
MSFFGSYDTDWRWIDEGHVETAKDMRQLESRLSKSDMDINGPFRVHFRTTNWERSKEDISGKGITRAPFGIIFRGTRYSNDVLVCASGSPPTIDGDVDTLFEWVDANSATNGNLSVYVKMDSTHVYFGITTNDTIQNQNGDSCAIYFETDHSNTGVSDQYDKRLRTYYSGAAWIDDWSLGGFGFWVVQPSLPTGVVIAQNFEAGVGMEYEAQINRSILNDSFNFDQDNERIGFAVIVENATVPLEEWPDGAQDVNIGDSDSWGELEIPEYEEIIIPLSITLFIAAVWKNQRKRRK